MDITERKRVESEIVRAKEEWEKTFDAVPDLIMILDLNHRIVRANRAMAARLATMSEDRLERPVSRWSMEPSARRILCSYEVDDGWSGAYGRGLRRKR